MDTDELRYLELLSESYPTVSAASAEAGRLGAALAQPKGTELFMSDIHGEYDAFAHLLRNGAGTIRAAIETIFGEELTLAEQRQLATLIYYPREKLNLILDQVEDMQGWMRTAIVRLIRVLAVITAHQTRASLREALPPEFADLIEELLAAEAADAAAASAAAAPESAAATSAAAAAHSARVAALLATPIRIGRAPALIEALCLLIQDRAIERLHLVGDVYDRGPAPDAIMDALARHPRLDIQWGNHDIVWMGAALGQRGCIAHVVRNCARYGNLSILDAYGISILPLATFALEAYRDDPCVAFGLKVNPGLSQQDYDMNVKIQKAMAIIQFKVEGQLIDAYPEFGLQDRKLLDKIDHARGTVVVDGVEYELTDTVLPTVDPADPYRLTPAEEEVMVALEQAFQGCEKLQRHMRLFLDRGSMYAIRGNTLLIHAGVPLNPDGALMQASIFGQTCGGKALYDLLEHYVRVAFDSPDPLERTRGRDLLWWMWLAPQSPQFAKSKMATFEIYFVADKAARKEVKNTFYASLDDPAALAVIFEDFGMDPASSRLVCGHVPVKAKDGEDPVKCGGRVVRIDGGFSRAYQPTTGIAGYTLVSDAQGWTLQAHEPLESAQAAIRDDLDICSACRVVEAASSPVFLADTPEGARMKERLAQLELLIEAYQTGRIPQHFGC